MDKRDFTLWAEKLRQYYQPSEDVSKRLAQVDLLAIVGPTGVGKTTIINELGLPQVLSDVTRPLRPGEKNHENYHFRDDLMNILKEIKGGEFAQFLISGSGEFYGTHINSYPQQGWCSMAIFATEIQNFRKLGFRKVIPVYIMPPGYVEWMRRIGTLRDGDIDARIAESITSLRTAMADPLYRYVLNDSLDLAVRDVKQIMEGKDVDLHRSQLARETADMLLERLGDQDDSMYFTNNN